MASRRRRRSSGSSWRAVVVERPSRRVCLAGPRSRQPSYPIGAGAVHGAQSTICSDVPSGGSATSCLKPPISQRCSTLRGHSGRVHQSRFHRRPWFVMVESSRLVDSARCRAEILNTIILQSSANNPIRLNHLFQCSLCLITPRPTVTEWRRCGGNNVLFIHKPNGPRNQTVRIVLTNAPRSK